MDSDAYLVELAAGLLYLPLGLGLLRLAARTGQTPERMLGLTFSLGGLAYLAFQVPVFVDAEAAERVFSFGARLALAGASYAIAEFTRRVFRPDAAWSWWLTVSVVALLAAGLALSAAFGDWGGTDLGAAAFWLEWLGQAVPCVWVIFEAVVHGVRARRRRRLGLADRATLGRYLLWGVFGTGQLGATVAVLPMYWVYQAEQRITPTMDALMGGFELLSVAAVWLVFFPPARFRRWVEEAPPGSTRCSGA